MILRMSLNEPENYLVPRFAVRQIAHHRVQIIHRASHLVPSSPPPIYRKFPPFCGSPAFKTSSGDMRQNYILIFSAGCRPVPTNALQILSMPDPSCLTRGPVLDLPSTSTSLQTHGFRLNITKTKFHGLIPRTNTLRHRGGTRNQESVPRCDD